MLLMSTSVCALAKIVTSPSLLIFWVFHTTTIYERLKTEKGRGREEKRRPEYMLSHQHETITETAGGFKNKETIL